MIQEPKKTVTQKLAYYYSNGFDESAKNDNSCDVRYQYYMEHGFDQDAKKDINSRVRLGYYRQNGFSKSAKKDGNWKIMVGYYDQHILDFDGLLSCESTVVKCVESNILIVEKIINRKINFTKVSHDLKPNEIKLVKSKYSYNIM